MKEGVKGVILACLIAVFLLQIDSVALAKLHAFIDLFDSSVFLKGPR